MPRDTRRQLRPLDPIWYVAFPTYYGLLALFGILAAAFPLPSFSDTSGPSYGQGWGVALAVSAALAAVGGTRSAMDRSAWLEIIATAGVIGCLLGYAGAIYEANLALEELGRVSALIMPATLALFPAVRIISALRTGRLSRPARKR